MNPCTELTIEFVEPFHFDDYRHNLGDDMYSQEWTIDELATSPTTVDCGNLVVSFTYLNGDPLDSAIFNDNQGTSPS